MGVNSTHTLGLVTVRIAMFSRGQNGAMSLIGPS
jgi:hypothetical protein